METRKKQIQPRFRQEPVNEPKLKDFLPSFTKEDGPVTKTLTVLGTPLAWIMGTFDNEHLPEQLIRTTGRELRGLVIRKPQHPKIENKQAVGGMQNAPPEHAPGEIDAGYRRLKELDWDTPTVRVVDSKQPIRNPAASSKKK